MRDKPFLFYYTDETRLSTEIWFQTPFVGNNAEKLLWLIYDVWRAHSNTIRRDPLRRYYFFFFFFILSLKPIIIRLL